VISGGFPFPFLDNNRSPPDHPTRILFTSTRQESGKDGRFSLSSAFFFEVNEPLHLSRPHPASPLPSSLPFPWIGSPFHKYIAPLCTLLPPSCQINVLFFCEYADSTGSCNLPGSFLFFFLLPFSPSTHLSRNGPDECTMRLFPATRTFSRSRGPPSNPPRTRWRLLFEAVSSLVRPVRVFLFSTVFLFTERAFFWSVWVFELVPFSFCLGGFVTPPGGIIKSFFLSRHPPPPSWSPLNPPPVMIKELNLLRSSSPPSPLSLLPPHDGASQENYFFFAVAGKSHVPDLPRIRLGSTGAINLFLQPFF